MILSWACALLGAGCFGYIVGHGAGFREGRLRGRAEILSESRGRR